MKLNVQTPFWIESESPANAFLSKVAVRDSNLFVNYDKVEAVERDEEESQQVVVLQGQSLGQEQDSLDAQSRALSKDTYKN